MRMPHAVARVPMQELASDVERIFDRVAQGESVIVIDKAGEDVAIVKPVRARRSRRKTAADLAAFRAAAGGWADVDTDAVVESLYDSRRQSSRPPVDL